MAISLFLIVSGSIGARVFRVEEAPCLDLIKSDFEFYDIFIIIIFKTSLIYHLKLKTKEIFIFLTL